MPTSGCSISPLLCTTDGSSDALKATWAVAVLANALKMIGIAQITGIVRVITGSFATKEDFRLFHVTYGDDVPHEVINPFGTPLLSRLHAIHRNEVETVPIFCALSYAYTLTSPGLGEARTLLAVFTAARLAHTLLYACAATPARSIAWGVATQCMLIMSGKVAAWVLPSASLGLQVLINAPLAVQWFISLGVLGSVWEQSRRHERFERRAGRTRERRALVAGGATSEEEEEEDGGGGGQREHDDDDGDEEQQAETVGARAAKEARVRRSGVTRIAAVRAV